MSSCYECRHANDFHSCPVCHHKYWTCTLTGEYIHEDKKSCIDFEKEVYSDGG